MIISNLVSAAAPPPVPAQANPGKLTPQNYRLGYTKTKSKQIVNEDSAKKIATAYRCANTISDDVGMMPLQVYTRFRNVTTRL